MTVTIGPSIGEGNTDHMDCSTIASAPGAAITTNAPLELSMMMYGMSADFQRDFAIWHQTFGGQGRRVTSAHHKTDLVAQLSRPAIVTVIGAHGLHAHKTLGYPCGCGGSARQGCTVCDVFTLATYPVIHARDQIEARNLPAKITTDVLIVDACGSWQGLHALNTRLTPGSVLILSNKPTLYASKAGVNSKHTVMPLMRRIDAVLKTNGRATTAANVVADIRPWLGAQPDPLWQLHVVP